ncbi:unnamed protein product [Heligmosomoides polygyrus]|uniref:Cyclin N-terminal domain-containing protein n=1 Tax=Heligmosomoides polygyrus TaxID=6339 RepID=A0A183G0W1_HELPZ|nr:unnamed protein product [Heligmosomoides polygyrus]
MECSTVEQRRIHGSSRDSPTYIPVGVAIAMIAAGTVAVRIHKVRHFKIHWVSACQLAAISLNAKEPDLLLAAFFVEESPADDIVNRTLLMEFYLDQSRPPKRYYCSIVNQLRRSILLKSRHREEIVGNLECL